MMRASPPLRSSSNVDEATFAGSFVSGRKRERERKRVLKREKEKMDVAIYIHVAGSH